MTSNASQTGGGGSSVGGANGLGQYGLPAPAFSAMQLPTFQATSDYTPLQASGNVGGSATNRSSAIPDSTTGNASATIGIGQTTYRQISLSGPRSFDIPANPSTSGLAVQVYEIEPYVKGGQKTDVLVPVSGHVQLQAGQSARFLVRATGLQAGSTQTNLGFGTLSVQVADRVVKPLPMMTWVNVNNAKERGASAGSVENVLQNFGITSSGTAGATAGDGAPENSYFFNVSTSNESKANPQSIAREIESTQAKLQQAHPGATLWVQVADEEDKTQAQVNSSVQWIGQVRQALQRDGSGAKLFVATQARNYNLAYASVVDGWATTQSNLGGGKSRDQSISLIQQAAQYYGHPVQLMEYPGNAFFDGQTASSAATSVASAGLDGASSWFLFSADNLDNLQSGVGEEGKGDIGGLVAIDNGNVMPTLALAEADYGSNLVGEARAIGSGATMSSGAGQVRTAGAQLDAYHQGYVPDFAAWEEQMAQQL